jgi:hypothetical protein
MSLLGEEDQQRVAGVMMRRLLEKLSHFQFREAHCQIVIRGVTDEWTKKAFDQK